MDEFDGGMGMPGDGPTGGSATPEMGGAGNCAELIAAMQTAWREFGLAEPELPWYFPTAP